MDNLKYLNKYQVLGIFTAFVGIFLFNVPRAWAVPSISFTNGPTGCYVAGDTVQFNWASSEIAHAALGFSFSAGIPPNQSGLDTGSNMVAGQGWHFENLSANGPYSQYLYVPMVSTGQVYFWVWGHDANHNTIAGPNSWPSIMIKNTRGECPDMTPPTFSGQPTVALSDSSSIKIRWNAPSDNVSVSYYQVKYKSGQTSLLTESDWSSATWSTNVPSPMASGTLQDHTITNLNPSTSYSIGIKACDTAGNCSAIASVISSTTAPPADTQSPGTPTGLGINTAGTPTSADLKWVVPSDNIGVTSYQLRYRSGASSFSEADWASAISATGLPTPSSPGATQYYILSGLTSATSYAIGLKACDAAGNCSPIATLSYYTSSSGGGYPTSCSNWVGPKPGTITGLHSMTTGTIPEIMWDIPAGASRYEIRAVSGGGTLTELNWNSTILVQTNKTPETACPGSTTSIGLTNLPSGISYTIAVKAVSSSGVMGDISNTIMLTPGSTGGTPAPTYGGTLKVTVKNTVGTLLPGAYASLSLNSATVGAAGPTNTSGEYYFYSLGTGSYRLTVTPPAGYGSVKYYDVTVTSGQTTTQEVLFASDGSIGNTPTALGNIKITIRDPKGLILSGVSVSISSRTSGANSYGTTGSDGSYTFSQMPSGTYSLAVSPPSGRTDLMGMGGGQTVDIVGGTTTYNDLYLTYSNTQYPTPIPTPTPTPYPQVGGTSLCGGVYVSGDGSGGSTPISGSKLTLIIGGYTYETTSDAVGQYCFKNIAGSGSYTLKATAGGRTDVSPQEMTGNASLYVGSQGGHDMYFSKSSSYPQPTPYPVPYPTPPSSPEPPVYRLPDQEQCIRNVLGEDRYISMKKGRIQPSSSEYDQVRSCFGFPTTSPTPIPVSPDYQPIPMPPTTPPVFHDECEKRDLPRMKQELKRFLKKLDEIDKQEDKLRKQGISLPTNFIFLMQNAREVFNKVQSATTCEDAFSAGSELPDIMQQLNQAFDSISQIQWAPQALKNFDKEISKFATQARSAVKRLQRRKFNVAVLASRVDDKEKELKDCRNKARDAINNMDVADFNDTMKTCFDGLNEAREVLDIVKSIDRARSYLAGTVDRLLKQAGSLVKSLSRNGQEDAATDVRVAMDELKAKRDEAVADYKDLQKNQDDLLDALSEVADLYYVLQDAMDSTRGVNTYEEVVGRPKEVFQRIELGRPTLDFFNGQNQQ